MSGFQGAALRLPGYAKPPTELPTRENAPKAAVCVMRVPDRVTSVHETAHIHGFRVVPAQAEPAAGSAANSGQGCQRAPVAPAT